MTAMTESTTTPKNFHTPKGNAMNRESLQLPAPEDWNQMQKADTDRYPRSVKATGMSLFTDQHSTEWARARAGS